MNDALIEMDDTVIEMNGTVEEMISTVVEMDKIAAEMECTVGKVSRIFVLTGRGIFENAFQSKPGNVSLFTLFQTGVWLAVYGVTVFFGRKAEFYFFRLINSGVSGVLEERKEFEFFPAKSNHIISGDVGNSVYITYFPKQIINIRVRHIKFSIFCPGTSSCNHIIHIIFCLGTAP